MRLSIIALALVLRGSAAVQLTSVLDPRPYESVYQTFFPKAQVYNNGGSVAACSAQCIITNAQQQTVYSATDTLLVSANQRRVFRFPLATAVTAEGAGDYHVTVTLLKPTYTPAPQLEVNTTVLNYPMMRFVTKKWKFAPNSPPSFWKGQLNYSYVILSHPTYSSREFDTWWLQTWPITDHSGPWVGRVRPQSLRWLYYIDPNSPHGMDMYANPPTPPEVGPNTQATLTASTSWVTGGYPNLEDPQDWELHYGNFSGTFHGYGPSLLAARSYEDDGSWATDKTPGATVDDNFSTSGEAQNSNAGPGGIWVSYDLGHSTLIDSILLVSDSNSTFSAPCDVNVYIDTSVNERGNADYLLTTVTFPPLDDGEFSELPLSDTTDPSVCAAVCARYVRLNILTQWSLSGGQPVEVSATNPIYSEVAFNKSTPSSFLGGAGSGSLEQPAQTSSNSGIQTTVSGSIVSRALDISYTLTSAKSGLRVEVCNNAGSVVRSLSLGPAQAGIHSLRIPLEDCPQGTYFVRIQADGAAVTKRVLVMR